MANLTTPVRKNFRTTKASADNNHVNESIFSIKKPLTGAEHDAKIKRPRTNEISQRSERLQSVVQKLNERKKVIFLREWILTVAFFTWLT